MNRKLRSKFAETLTETLVAVLIIALVSVALASMVQAAVRSNNSAIQMDDELYSAISAMETHSGCESEDGTVTITFGSGSTAKSTTTDVTVYSDANGALKSYE